MQLTKWVNISLGSQIIDRKDFMLITLFLFIPILAMLAVSLYLCGGSFTYTLDDPYIHLELAKNIMLGNYGINISEFSAPSSSIIWPFLLAPFSLLPLEYYEIVPFVLNTIFTILIGLVLVNIFLESGKLFSLVTTLTLMISINIYGLIFTGMEHSLQCLLVVISVYFLINFEKICQKNYKSLFYFCLFLLPLVRYEGLAISIPILFYICIKEKKEILAYITLLFIAIAILLFSVYLNKNGCSFLPSSVLAKTDGNILSSSFSRFSSHQALLLGIILFCMFTWDKNKTLISILLSTFILHMLCGRNGWFGRYEVYYIIFLLVPILSFTQNKLSSIKNLVLLLLLPVFFIPLFKVTLRTPAASANILHQQCQMAEVAKKLDSPVAVNDLGLVALRTEKYVLDLWGLGSYEALGERKSKPKNANWIEELMKKNSVHYAIIYDAWFKYIPNNWIKVGELHLCGRKITPASDTVSFYATTEKHAANLSNILMQQRSQQIIEKFSYTLLGE